jgi:hypothetical protein
MTVRKETASPYHCANSRRYNPNWEESFFLVDSKFLPFKKWKRKKLARLCILSDLEMLPKSK